MFSEQKSTDCEDLTYFEFQNIIHNTNTKQLIHMKNHYQQKLFDVLRCYQKNRKFEQQIQRRINKFVFCPGIPYPYHCTERREDIEYYLEHLVYSIELTKGAKETVRLLSKQKKGNYCPYLLFIPMSIDNIHNNKQYIYNNDERHMLSRYTPKIANESQFPVEFHITSHGNHEPPSIDTLNPIKELSPKEFAFKFDAMLRNCKLDKVLNTKNVIKFVFHICNGAFCEINDDDEEEEISDKVRNETFIGRFRSNMIKYGYNNIIITGYRGYYQTMRSGSGIRVGNKLTNATKDIDAKQVEFTIYPDGCVDIPKLYDFEVECDTDYE